jgi:uncharacterized protein with PIN domain
VIHLDTSVLVDALTGTRRTGASFRRAAAEDERMLISTLAVYEWVRGPRTREELIDQETFFYVSLQYLSDMPSLCSRPISSAESALRGGVWRTSPLRRVP